VAISDPPVVGAVIVIALGQAVTDPDLFQVVEAFVDVVHPQRPFVGLGSQGVLLAAHVGLSEAYQRIDQAC